MQLLTVYNSLNRKKEAFAPIQPPYVGMYVCGPTVYSNVHLGNCRTFLSFDIIYRYLLHLGYKVRYVRNITDVGHITTDYDEGVDRIGTQARLEQLEPMEIVQKYTVDFHRVMHEMNNLPPSLEPTATGHIIEQLEMAKVILEKGIAYEVNGSVYFDVRKYMELHNYGELSGRNVEELLEKTRDLEGQEEKRYFADFALWKAAAPEHIMRWPSPWGEGFPGWHLECSAMSAKYLGKNFDIHGGGMDLKFPHHECEVAQNTVSTGEGSVRYWLHTNMLTVNGQKMSKSLGNSFLPHELFSGDHPVLERGYSPMTVRFFMLQAHYRSTLDFSNEALQAAEKGFVRLKQAYERLSSLKPGPTSTHDVKAWAEKGYEAMNDDFNTPLLIAQLFEGVNWINSISEGKTSLNQADMNLFREKWAAFTEDILGLKPEATGGKNDNVDGLMQLVFEWRNRVREAKDFQTSDYIRDKLKDVGFEIKDSKEGTTWEYK
ncbi:MAG: cysteine--tRNA ligase [Bacteroidota bacterium]|nr:cysteine--tRNA ligase [Bacteroidota bacterium]